ncbi:MAG: hypothetical protein ACRD1M_15725 [Terriglobales bacterium]
MQTTRLPRLDALSLPPQRASVPGAPALVGLRPEFAWRQRAPALLGERATGAFIRPSCLVMSGNYGQKLRL